MFQNIKAVIFDLDGTLIDSMGIWHGIDVEYLGRFQIPLPEDLQPSIEGMSFHETAIYFKNRFQIPDSLEQIKQNWNDMARDKYINEVPLKAGVSQFLAKCKEMNLLIGIATSNSRELVEAILKAHKIDTYFSSIITASEVKKGKPAPDVYLAAAQELGVDPTQCLVFEDITAGIMAGKNAGMRVCAVEDDYSKPQTEQKKELADFYICSYHELV